MRLGPLPPPKGLSPPAAGVSVTEAALISEPSSIMAADEPDRHASPSHESEDEEVDGGDIVWRALPLPLAVLTHRRSVIAGQVQTRRPRSWIRCLGHTPPQRYFNLRI